MAERDPTDAGGGAATGAAPAAAMPHPTVPAPAMPAQGPPPIDPAHPSFGPVPVGIARPWMPALQSLRGLAALWVVLYHLDVILSNTTAGILALPGLRFGWLGVDLFFVLSAYLLAQPFFGPHPPRTWPFLVDRFLRIAPAFYVAFVLAVVVILVVEPHDWHPRLAAWSLVFLQTFTFPTFEAVNPVFWTLAVEMQFYLVLPVLVKAFQGRWWLVALAACLAFTFLFRGLVYLRGDETAFMLTTFNFPAFLGHFALGLAAARIRRITAPIGSGVRRVVFLAGIPLVIGPVLLWIPQGSVGYGFESLEGQVLVRTLCACGFALIVFATAAGGMVARMLAWTPLAWLGAISYSLYLAHVPVQSVAERLFDPGPYRSEFLVTGALLSLLAGWLLYAVVEAPAERWRRRRKRGRERRRAGRRAAAQQP